ncbi:MAG: Amidohydrolase 2 [Candidatus Giovannonibacteria bacterium GW2011_GWA2_44_13b]|uniref:Amidohydrolase 2 n=2 Tax=Candidatus Giovannoniibacteriota TaxID=1752738 RepID=A0A0G1H217_9BACT|nr:MAG: Amidohydrolase 2 [Candidatus Nomurabacteria bacterium GW2011_GWA1_40_8]KKT41416.1 MAG: Amidohydrolase 2 [Candidatus Giovannonibacteria bacterium GW2011_GWA2_44_13b]OGF82684.1 MAG: hypothetical protein A2924_00775 [Candidatus Giovannonibacteria bacterium RIFCSPLOWO2_01_FULL_44_16]
MIIDAHTHIGRVPDSKFKKLGFEEILKLFLKEMRSNKVDHAVVIASYKRTSFNLNMMEELQLVKGIKNITAIGSIDILNYSKKDIDLLDEFLDKKIIKGIKLHLGYQYFYANEDKCRPIYELCLKHDAPVIFHTGDTLTIPGERPAKIKYSHPLLIDDVAAEYPDLKIIVAHLGNPWLVDCAEVLYKNDNVYADISGLVVVDKDIFSPYGETMKKKIRALFEYSDPRKLLYGTDWPLASMKSYIKFTKGLGIPKKDLDYVFYKNAVELFKL